MHSTAVVKLGGSLLDYPPWPQRLRRFLGTYPHHCVIVVGGGRTVDLIREWQAIHGFEDAAAHELALHAMQLNARIVARIMNAQLVASLAEAQSCWQQEVLTVLDVVAALSKSRAAGCLPANWNATSDSIAALVAGDWQMQRLALLKSADLPAAAGLNTAAAHQLVDPLIPSLVEQYSLAVDWRNLRSD